jgi:uncharacterized protein YydD (DUF2326 family)
VALMKILQIYSSNKKFKWVKFNEHLNVILGETNDRKQTDKDTHNLGKSTLIAVIDYMLLKEMSTEDFFKKNYSLLKDFTFFMELKKDNNSYVTIKRGVDNNTKISIKFHTIPYQDFRYETVWDYKNLALTSKIQEKNPKTILNDYFSHLNNEKYNFRKFSGYFLRTQYDYEDIFKLNKFRGKMIDWKPALIDLLGFDGELLSEKLKLENQLDLTRKYLEDIKKDLKVNDSQIDAINSIIDAKIEDKEKLENEVSRFDFYDKERENMRSLVNDIELKISELNKLEYKLSYEVGKIQEALKNKLDFDIDKVETIFKEAKILFGDQIKKSYSDLLQFNKDLIQERNAYQEKVLKGKNEQLGFIREELKELNAERVVKLSYLKNSDTMVKFKEYQNELLKLESEIKDLERKIKDVDVIKSIKERIRETEENLQISIERLKKHLDESNECYAELKSHFRSLTKAILGEPAILYYEINTNNNPDFYANFISVNDSQVTSQSDGYSYRKMLCVCFDLAMLITYSQKNFIRFVYHDGAYESMSDTIKIKYLDTIRKVCKEYDIQYILTTLYDDIPRDSNNELYKFSEDEIALKLNDSDNNQGRLFSMKF